MSSMMSSSPISLDVTDDVTSVKHTFYGIICKILLGYDVKMRLFKIFRNFQNGRPFEVRVIF